MNKRATQSEVLASSPSNVQTLDKSKLMLLRAHITILKCLIPIRSIPCGSRFNDQVLGSIKRYDDLDFPKRLSPL